MQQRLRLRMSIRTVSNERMTMEIETLGASMLFKMFYIVASPYLHIIGI